MAKRAIDHIAFVTDPLAHTTSANAVSVAAEKMQLAALMVWGMLVPTRWIEGRLRLPSGRKKCLVCKKVGWHSELRHWRFQNLELEAFLDNFVDDPSDKECADENTD